MHIIQGYVNFNMFCVKFFFINQNMIKYLTRYKRTILIANTIVTDYPLYFSYKITHRK